ncbi:SDR family NAD(P)-dependent oxidoreductase [Burkholderia diffusa]|uniref:SDR family NAD(P)-dependent oxidoreductase n=1 Tax=Burkholderia diffusa TaxID=488732 RepID=UPI00158CD957|nr:SDR family NAD(P)-dependent oxidoreductase [Burkholderia diffusa]
MKRIALLTDVEDEVGKCIAARLAREGVTVVVASVRLDVAQRVADEFAANDQDATALALDVGDESSVNAVYSAIEQRFGRLDILVNNASVRGPEAGALTRVEDTSLSTWEHTLNFNLNGTFLMCRGAIPLMRRGQFGRVVNISSRSARGRTALPDSSYVASKSAVLGLSRVLAGEVGHAGITVNCIAPSYVSSSGALLTEHVPNCFERSIGESAVGRRAVPEDIAEAVAFLCSDGAAFITGAVLDVNGGTFMT